MMLYDKIKKLCDEKHMKIRELEFIASVPYGTIGHWKRSIPRVDTLKAVANALDMTIDELMGD